MEPRGKRLDDLGGWWTPAENRTIVAGHEDGLVHLAVVTEVHTPVDSQLHLLEALILSLIACQVEELQLIGAIFSHAWNK